MFAAMTQLRFMSMDVLILPETPFVLSSQRLEESVDYIEHPRQRKRISLVSLSSVLSKVSFDSLDDNI